MNRVITPDEMRAMQREIDAADDQARREAIADETSSKGEITDNRKHRKWTRNTDKTLVAGMLARYTHDLFIISALIDAAQVSAKKLVDAMSALAQQWPSLREQVAQKRYIDIADTLSPDLGIEISRIAVPAELATRLHQEIEEVEMSKQIVAARFKDSGFMGPFIEEKKVAELMDAYRVRYDDGAKCHAHCIRRVESLQNEFEDLALSPNQQTVLVFGITHAPKGSKGYDNKVAEAGEEISASNLANLEAAAPAAPIPPPHLILG